ncbi:MAG: hypothetical protein ABIU05_17290 [Nitrospirales bacterium]
MKCGELGFTNADGEPCGQNLQAGAKCCLWHDQTPKGKRRADLQRRRGGITSRAKSALPASYFVKPFDSVDSIISWAHEMAGKVLKEDVDPRRSSEARGFAQLALSAHQARTQQELVDALLRLEHGGAAFALLARLQDSTAAPRKPLP